MEFEFDPVKSEANKAKHGIDFNEATKLWEDESRIEIPARTTGEPRSLVIGKIEGRHWSGVITYRGEKTRIVSVRRLRREEVQLYEGQGE
ncbi:MAG: BrnT family toxin [Candidatus Limnocylindria bacterium]